MQNADKLFRKPLESAFAASLEFLQNLDRSSVAATADLATLRKQLVKPLAAEGLPSEQVVAELARDVEGGLIGSAGGRFYAWVIGGSLPSALAADWLTSAWDQNAPLYATSPASAVTEEIAGAWLKELLNIPAHSSFALVTGCQMAHTTCLAAARHALLAKQNWNVEERGLYGAPAIRILTGRTIHGTFERSVALLGLGHANIQRLPVDSEDRLEPATLEKALKENLGAPTLVLLQAGEINIGAFDPFAELVPLAHKYGAWVHVDGAMGLWAAACPRLKHLMAGCEQADSWATDGHKWLNVPYDCGYALVADAKSHRASMTHDASYITLASAVRDEMAYTPEWSRRARAFATYAAIRELGRNGVADLVDRCCRHTHSIVTGIGKLDGAEMLWEPVINQGLVRFLDSKPGATDADHDRRTDEAVAAINATGEAFFSGTTWRGKRAMRVSVSGWQTNESDVQRAIAAAKKVLANFAKRLDPQPTSAS
jgi:glutamate/tyrosine decarboxylase-like PLP-dependent enzyme